MDYFANRYDPDPDARAARLTPEVISFWKQQIEEAAPLVEPGDHPCSYASWTNALANVHARAPLFVAGLDRMGRPHRVPDLIALAEDVATPRWPTPRRDLVEFALTFLEADVMLFRSGYAKRHMLTRLKQAELTTTDKQRLEAMLRQSVLQGTGLEEYRNWCRLAGHLARQRELEVFEAWLSEKADGAVLTLSMADGHLWQQIANAQLSETDRAKVEKVRWTGPSKWGVRWPQMDRAVPNIVDQDHRIRRNAWRMLDRIYRCRIPAAQ